MPARAWKHVSIKVEEAYRIWNLIVNISAQKLILAVAEFTSVSTAAARCCMSFKRGYATLVGDYSSQIQGSADNTTVGIGVCFNGVSRRDERDGQQTNLHKKA
jgi:hypothetical protein